MIKIVPPLERIDQIKEEIERISVEADEMAQLWSTERREATQAEQERFNALVGEDGLGTSDGCAQQVLYAELDTMTKLQAGIEARDRNRRNVTPPQSDDSDAPDPVPAGVRRELPMGSTRAFIVPVEARTGADAKLREVGDAWGATKQERIDNAYAAGMWMIAKIWPHHPDPEVSRQPMVAQAQDWCVRHGILNQQDTTTPGKGIETIPTPLASTIIEIRDLYGVFRSHTNVRPMSSKTEDVAKFASGLQVGLAAELAARALTEKTWTQVNLVAKTAGGYAMWSNEVGQDSIVSMAADLARDFGIAFAYREDFTGFAGDGTVDFDNMGITGIVESLHANATLTLAAGKTAVTDIALQDFETLMGLVKTRRTARRWFCTEEVYYASMHPIKTAAGGNTIATLTDGDPVEPNDDFRFLGIPGAFVDDGILPGLAASAGTKGVVVLGDLMQGTEFGDRRMMELMVSEHIKVLEYATVLTANARWDIQVHATGENRDQRVIGQIQLAAA